MKSRETPQSEEAPILINLTGDYVIPKTTEVKSGSVTGDLRLASLDSFLHTLNEALAGTENVKLDDKLNSFLAQVAKLVKDSCLENSVELEVTSKLTPSINELKYTFKFNILKGLKRPNLSKTPRQ